MSDIHVRTVRPLLVLLAAVALTGGCRGSSNLPPDIWATVDGREIHRDDVEKAFRRVQPATPNPQPSEDEILAAKLSLLDDFITQDILDARAAELKLDVTSTELEAAFNDRKQSMSDEAFQAQLAQRGLTADDLRDGLRRELLANKVIDHDVLSRIVISDDDIKAYYEQHKAEFNVAETQYHIAQIVITPTKDPEIRNRKNDDATTPIEAQHKAEMLMERLKGGADFGGLAMDYSEDAQTAPQGGDLGFVSATQLKQVPEALRDAVLKAEPGNVNVVSGGGAYTIVMLIARESPGQRDLASPGVKDGISTGLHDRKATLLRAAYISTARNNAKIVNNLARMIVDTLGKLPGLAPAAPGK